MRFYSKFTGRELDDHILSAIKFYEDAFEHLPGKKTPIHDIEFSVVDTETTGLDPRKDRVLSIGAVKVIRYSIPLELTYEGFIKYGDYNPGNEVEVHGIMKKHVDEALSPAETLSDFLRCIGSSIIVGHHIGFDVKLINKSMKKHLGIKLKNKVIDTAILDQRIDNPHQLSHRPKTLDNLCEKYGITTVERHSAIGDAYTTALVFMKILKKLQNRGINQHSDL